MRWERFGLNFCSGLKVVWDGSHPALGTATSPLSLLEWRISGFLLHLEHAQRRPNSYGNSMKTSKLMSGSSSKPHCTRSRRSDTPALVPPGLRSFDCWCPSCRSCSKVWGAKRRLTICYSTLVLQTLPSAAEKLYENRLTCHEWLISVRLEKHPTSQSSNTHWREVTSQITETPPQEQRSRTAPWQDVPVASTQWRHPLKGPFRGSAGNGQAKLSKN